MIIKLRTKKFPITRATNTSHLGKIAIKIQRREKKKSTNTKEAWNTPVPSVLLPTHEPTCRIYLFVCSQRSDSHAQTLFFLFSRLFAPMPAVGRYTCREIANGIRTPQLPSASFLFEYSFVLPPILYAYHVVDFILPRSFAHWPPLKRQFSPIELRVQHNCSFLSHCCFVCLLLLHLLVQMSQWECFVRAVVSKVFNPPHKMHRSKS